MALKTLPSLFIYPNLSVGVDMNTTFQTFLDNVNEYAGMGFVVPKTGTIAKIGFLTGTVSGFVGDLRAGLYLNSPGSGLPSATPYGGMAEGVLVNPLASTAYEITLATPANAVRGDRVAAKIRIGAFTSGGLTLRRHDSSREIVSMPYFFFDNGTGGTRTIHPPIFWVVYGDGTVAALPGTYSQIGLSTVTIGPSTNPNEVGNKFRLPFRARVSGLRMIWSAGNAFAGTPGERFAILDSALTVLASGIHLQTDAGQGTGLVDLWFTTPVLLNPDTDYYATYFPGGATGREWFKWTFLNNAAKDACLSSDFKAVERQIPNPFAVLEPVMYPMALIIDAVDVTGPLRAPAFAAGGFNG